MKSLQRMVLVASLLLALPVVGLTRDPMLSKAESLLRDGNAEAAYALLEPLEAAQSGDPVYDYLLATACLSSGRLSQATFIYERILAVRPDYIGVRADMGRAYYQMGDFAKARIEFEAVLGFANVPPDLRSAVNQYMSAMEQRAQQARTVVLGFIEIGPGRDSNVGSATSTSPITLSDGSQYFLDRTSLPRRDTYLAFAAGLEVNHALDERLSAYVAGEARRRSHNSVDTANYNTADGRVGLQYSGGSYVVRGGFITGRYWLSGTATRDQSGATLDWRNALDNANQLSLGASLLRFTYLPATMRSYDSDLYTLSAGWTHAIAPGTSGGLTLSAGNDNATRGRDDGDKAFWGIRGTLQHEFFSGLGGYLVAGWQAGNYSRRNATYGGTREDWQSDVTAGLVWSFIDRWSLRPQLSFSKNASNLPIYAYDRLDASVVLRKDF